MKLRKLNGYGQEIEEKNEGQQEIYLTESQYLYNRKEVRPIFIYTSLMTAGIVCGTFGVLIGYLVTKIR